MPTYQYECTACGHEFEDLQSMTEPKFVKCPKCGKNKLVRLIGSGSGVIFKGSGFYETDYKKKSSPAETKPVSPAGGTAPASESKPASKPTVSPTSNGSCGSGCGCHPPRQ
ncbi:MAG: zinc ribbon domain-containing protein [Candidatus Omnitrophica bacterium]|nr:zinc ribbon domain-containing protein [Candidatus Omnitrophota bacterium]